jgi:hypothetical protein
MVILSKAIYRFNAISIKVPTQLILDRDRKINSQIHLEPPKTQGIKKYSQQ